MARIMCNYHSVPHDAVRWHRFDAPLINVPCPRAANIFHRNRHHNHLNLNTLQKSNSNILLFYY